MRTVCAASILLAVGILSGCNPAPGYKPVPVATVETISVEPGHEEQLFPLSVGASWTYTHTDIGTLKGQPPVKQVHEDIYTVAKVTETPSGTRARIDITQDGRPADRQYYLMSRKGFFQETAAEMNVDTATVIQDVHFAPAMPVILFPVVQDSSYPYEGTGQYLDNGHRIRVKGEIRTLGSQTVDTDLAAAGSPAQGSRVAGTGVEARFHSFEPGSECDFVISSWYRPRLGMIRLTQELTRGNISMYTILSLKNYKIK